MNSNKSYISDKFYTDNYAKQSWRDQRQSQINYFVKKISKLNVLKKGHKVLDVGCGSGELPPILKKQFGINASGVEINKVAISEARKRGVSVKYADLEMKWPFANHTFDSVIGIEIIEHLTDPDHFLQESKRILNKNGTLILTTPNLANWFNRVIFLFGYQPFFLEASTVDKTVGLSFTRKLTPSRVPVGHIRVFTTKAMFDLLTLHGFKNIQIIGSKVDCLPLPMGIVDRFFSRFSSLSSDMLVIAKS